MEGTEGKVIGAYSFLACHPQFTPASLEKIAHEKGSQKFGNGTYLLSLEHKGEKYQVINAFHPYQIEQFQLEQNTFAVLACSSSTDYSVLAEEMVGFFIPSVEYQIKCSLIASYSLNI